MKFIIFLILKYFWGSLYLVTSIGKLLDNRGFAKVIETYKIPMVQGSWLLGFALVFSLFELYIGWSLIKKNTKSIHYLYLNAFNAIYLIMVSLTYYRGIALENCGCFGVFWARPLTVYTIGEDALFLLSSLVLWRIANSKIG
jgi:hypothetical protein